MKTKTQHAALRIEDMDPKYTIRIVMRPKNRAGQPPRPALRTEKQVTGA
jgi:hypothetical protein